MRLIDADKLREAVVDAWLGASSDDMVTYKFAVQAIDAAPTVDAVQHGSHENRGGNFWCTACGRGYPYKCDFCPLCGAKMDGGSRK